MFKKITIFIILLFICGCSIKKSNNVTTIIEENETNVIGINYPTTNTKLDTYIKNDINKIINEFKNTNNGELNIDYIFNDINNYLSIALFIYINDNNNINEYIITYAFDKNSNKLLDISDITDDIDIIEEVNNSNDLNFTFDNNNLTIYKDNDSTNIPISDLNLKIDLKNKNKLKKTSIEIPNRVIDINEKLVAITFDDGPSIYTNELIEYLNSEGCPATFFVLGNKVEIYSDILKKSINYGNEIGNHSYNHKWLIKLDENEIEEQITKTQNIIKEYTGYTPKLLRPTYGSVNNIIKDKINLDVVLWNVDTMDWKYKSVDKIVARATKNLKDGNIILMHDTHKRTVEAIKKIVPIIKKQGFTCVTVSEMKEANLIRERSNEWRS